MPPADAAVDPATGSMFDAAHVAGRGGRPEQQDACDALQAGGRWCWVVSDGLGGHRGGAMAARLAVEAALGTFREHPEVSPAAVSRAIAAAHAAVVAGQREDPQVSGMRATIVVLLADARQAVWGHVGDSRLYRLEGGSVRHKTRDHSVSQARVDAGEIAAIDQGRDADRDRLFRAIGQANAVEPAVLAAPEPLHQGDAFLLCTDGFWSTLSDTAIEIDFAATAAAEDWLARLDQRAAPRRADDADNYTAVAIRVRPTADLPPSRPLAAPAAPDPAASAAIGAAPPSARRTGRPTNRLPIGLLGGLLFAAALVAIGFVVRDRLAGRGTTSTTGATPPAVTVTPPTATVPAKPGAQETQETQETPGTLATPAATAGRVPPSSPVASPEDLPPGVVLRVATGDRFSSLTTAMAAASPGDEIWIARGVYRVSGLVVDEELHLRGAGREVTTLDASGGSGLVMTATAGSLADLEVCCAATGPVLDLGGAFAGIVSRLRLRDGAGTGVRVRDTAAPTIEDTIIEGIKGHRVVIDGQARPVIRGVAGR